MRWAWSLRALILAVLVAPALLAFPASDPPVANGVGALPECRLDDIFTEPRGYDDWSTTQVDWILTLGPKYKPPDLVSVREGGVAGGGLIRQVVIEDLRAMARAAQDNGTPLVAWSPYRGYRQQVALFNGYAGFNKKTGKYTSFDSAITFSARPGHSEHQTGLTIDFVAVGDTGLTSNWEVTRTGAWMATNAWKYGWLMSYPDGKQDVACYRYEPWHYRYVGRDMAAKIHDSGLTIREYLWANYTQVDPACVALPAPTLITPGKPRSCALAVASPSASATAPPTGTAGPIDTPRPTAGSPGTSAMPGSSAEPQPASALERAIPIGVALVAAVVAMLGFMLWRSSRRASRYR